MGVLKWLFISSLVYSVSCFDKDNEGYRQALGTTPFPDTIVDVAKRIQGPTIEGKVNVTYDITPNMTTEGVIRETLKKLYDQHQAELQGQLIQKGMRTEFPCPILEPSEEIPTSVHRLRPGDVKVIGALGDSVSAGTGIEAQSLLGDAYEWRGLTFSGGGFGEFEQVVTLPNILKKYNQGLYGYAREMSYFYERSKSVLNVAVPWSTSAEMPGQANELVKRMQSNTHMNFKEDWKVVTIFIGHNDLCTFQCHDKYKYGKESYIRHIQEALDLLYLNVPRVFINLMEPYNMTHIVDESFEGYMCPIIHSVACHCAYTEDRSSWVQAYTDYIESIHKLVNSGRYEGKEDFTVVVQPYMRKTKPGYIEGTNIVDPKFFAADCFHWSRITQEEAAKGLWSNMITPVGSKKIKWTFFDPLECPTEERPFLFTKKNSVGVVTKSPATGTTSQTMPGSVTVPPSSETQSSMVNPVRVSIYVCVTVAFVGLVIGMSMLAMRCLKKSSDEMALIDEGHSPQYQTHYCS